MNTFCKILCVIGFSLTIGLYVSACVSSLHLDNLDWKTERVENGYN